MDRTANITNWGFVISLSDFYHYIMSKPYNSQNCISLLTDSHKNWRLQSPDYVRIEMQEGRAVKLSHILVPKTQPALVVCNTWRVPKEPLEFHGNDGHSETALPRPRILRAVQKLQLL